MPHTDLLICLIVDDEQQSIDGLQAMLERRFETECRVAATCTDALQVPQLLHIHQPDLLFLDVEMPRLTGLDVLRMLPERRCEVVFTTAYTQYAVEAIKLQAADYLIKPYSVEELGDALQRCRERLQVNHVLKRGLATGAPVRFAITAQNGVHLIVGTAEIVWVEAVSNYSILHFTERPKLTVTKTLKEFDDQLTPHGFFRSHNGFLVNLQHVHSFHTQAGEDYLLMTGEARVPLSRRRKTDFFELVQRI